MLFSSTEFLLAFFPIVLIGYFLVLKKSRKAQNVFLCIASLLFYAWGEPKFVFVMLASIFINWAMGIFISKNTEKVKISRFFVALAVVANMGLLFVFKYVAFTLTNINNIFGSGFFVPSIVLPIGISFFTFQGLSYVIDVYRQKGKVQKNFLNVALYVSFFPQLIAGPIVRYETVANEIDNRHENWADFTYGVERFILGLSKKLLLADKLAVLSDQYFTIVNGSTGASVVG
ncbi:MAG: MBOAT family O-acyltransferase, partial [Oscillospiraceae bacterium]